MKITIITDGNKVLGMGHVYQAVTLAGELSKETGAQCQISFITKSDQIVIDRLSEAGFDVCRLPDDDAIFARLVSMAPDRIIFDKLDVSPLLARRIKESIRRKLIIFTNLTTANQYADMTVLAGMGRNFKNVREVDPLSGAVHYYGPRYWMLRPEFFTYTGVTKRPLSRVKKIMLIFGGVDQSNLTSLVLSELLRMDCPFEITAVVGTAFTHQDRLHAVVERNRMTRSRIHIVSNLKNVAETMHQADVVFACPGLSYYEALAVGTPVLGFHQNEMQHDVHREHLTTLDKQEICKLSSIIANKSFIFPDDPLIASMEIGQGRDEIVQAILS